MKPVQAPHIPIYFGGSSDAAIPVAGKHADIYALWGETQAQVREAIARVRAAAAKHGRQIRFSLSLRPVIADTEEAAWKRADEIVERTRALRDAAGLSTTTHAPPNALQSVRTRARRRGGQVGGRGPVGVLGAGGLEDGGAGDEHVHAGLGHLLDVVHRHAAVDLEADVVALRRRPRLRPAVTF